MSLLEKLERAVGRYALSNVSIYVVIGQVFVLLGVMFNVLNLENFILVPTLVKLGQWWRLVTFPFYLAPPSGTFGPIFTAFALYMFYMMGTALESHWGAFRYNLFLFLGYALTVGAAFITPNSAVTNLFLGASVFLAFAYLYPDFEFIIFFILPVKVKWLALLAWVGYGVSFFTGSLPVRLQILASVGNFLLFFSGDILWGMRRGQKAMARKARDIVEANAPRHRCHVCGKTDLTNPEMDFRYCSKCAGDECYCPEHIHAHAHVVAPDEPAKT
jgi:ribosomal protein L37AE/L43A